MAILSVEMPTYSDTVYTFSMSLEGQSLFFKFYWNSRAKSWHMDIKQADLTPVVLGSAIVPQYPMMLDYTLEDYGLTGYFLLLPSNNSVVSQLSDEPSVMSEFFTLLYVYNKDD